MRRNSIEIEVVHADAMQFACDLLALKHAQRLYGLDAAVYARLVQDGATPALPGVGRHTVQQSHGAVAARYLGFLGVNAIEDFGYKQIRDFGRRAITTFAQEMDGIGHIALTVHGPGYGLDEIEAFESELAGIVDAITLGEKPPDLARISFVEHSADRAARLDAALQSILPERRIAILGNGRISGIRSAKEEAFRSVGYDSSSKPRVFVAMPFTAEKHDTFHYGIQGAINAAGFLAERADMAAFTGDVMGWVKDRISGASLVVADLSGANPNVYLEVGYAWAKGVPTVLLIDDAGALKFDVRGQRCLTYASIRELEQKLSEELARLKDC
jgi:hypothetical protein